MWLNKAARLFEKVVQRVSVGFGSLGVGMLVLMIFVIVTDVTMRYFGRPLLGFFEVTQLLMISLVFFALAYTQMKKGNVSVDFIVSRFPKRVQGIIDSVTYLISLGLFSLIVWRTALRAETFRLNNEVTATLGIPTFPFLLVIALGSGLLSLVLLVDLVHSLTQAVKK